MRHCTVLKRQTPRTGPISEAAASGGITGAINLNPGARKIHGASSANQDNPSVTWWQKCGPSYEVETETSQLDQVNQGNYLLSQD